MNSSDITIGVLALQGDFIEHIHMLEACGVRAVPVRYADELKELSGLIIPGGESTAVAKLTDEGSAPIFSAIKKRIEENMPVYGTCMGSIFLARDIEGSAQGRLAVMDIKVKRNAFGPQKRSFEADMAIPALGAEPFPAVFIRAPIILESGQGVQVLARINESKDSEENKERNGIVMARQDNLLVTAFHPEITNDLRVHQYFIAMVREYSLTLAR
jgi:5'-phosphate synthase pdxT subunit